jgi:hypothetical protein
MLERPKRGGIILRFCDMVFNLLFAFVALSQVSAKRIELPQGGGGQDTSRKKVVMDVNVDETGEVAVTGATGRAYSLPPLEVGSKARLDSLITLTEWLREGYSQNREVAPGDTIQLQIRSGRECPMQYTADVYTAAQGLDTGNPDGKVVKAFIVVEPYK